MSILIKGMEMPRGCAFCKIARRNGKKMVCPFSYEEWDIRDPMSSDFRLVSCPLVPVPPHGRLIDADALIKGVEADAIWKYNAINEYDSGIRTGARTITRLVSNAPTIIPAEPCEEKGE